MRSIEVSACINKTASRFADLQLCRTHDRKVHSPTYASRAPHAASAQIANPRSSELEKLKCPANASCLVATHGYRTRCSRCCERQLTSLLERCEKPGQRSESRSGEVSSAHFNFTFVTSLYNDLIPQPHLTYIHPGYAKVLIIHSVNHTAMLRSFHHHFFQEKDPNNAAITCKQLPVFKTHHFWHEHLAVQLASALE